MKFSMILATDSQGAIGNNGDLIIKCKADMHRFRAITNGKALIMGRKTFDSLPHFLPGRFHIVVTSNNDLKMNNELSTYLEHQQGNYTDTPVLFVSSLDQALDIAIEYSKFYNWPYDPNECVIIGGSSIYNDAIRYNIVETIYHTIFDYKVSDYDTYVDISCFDSANSQPIGMMKCYVSELQLPVMLNVEFAQYELKWYSTKVLK